MLVIEVRMRIGAKRKSLKEIDIDG